MTIATQSDAGPTASPSRPAQGGHAVQRQTKDQNVTDIVRHLSASLRRSRGRNQRHQRQCEAALAQCPHRSGPVGRGRSGVRRRGPGNAKVAGKTSEVAGELATDTQKTIDDLLDLIGTSIRGTRLSDIALMNIDLIDRCLYERSCDVRWWATDSSVVDALMLGTEESRAFASQRLGVILNAYTVYFDLVLCDTAGNVVANGRPDQYSSVGSIVANQDWFQSAMITQHGRRIRIPDRPRVALVGNQPALVYSCSVREGGKATGKTLGVLGIVFRWEALAQTILAQVPLSEAERKQTRCQSSTTKDGSWPTRGAVICKKRSVFPRCKSTSPRRRISPRSSTTAGRAAWPTPWLQASRPIQPAGIP